MKRIILCLLSIYYFNLSFAQSFKLVLSVNDEITKSNDVCDLIIQTQDGEKFTLDYNIVELIFTDSFSNKLKIVDDSEDLLITVKYLCKHFKEKSTFKIKLKSYLLKRDYIILRIYTRNYKSCRNLYFPEGVDYVYEYDSYSQSVRIPSKPSLFQRIFR